MKKFLFIIAMCPWLIFANGTQSDTLYWIKVQAQTKEERTQIADMGVAIESVQDDYVVVFAGADEKLLLEKTGKVEVAFALEGDLFPEKADFPPSDSQFHNYGELTEALQKLQKNNPDIVQMYSIGRSVEGRDIWGVTLTGPTYLESSKPGIIFMGTHHAREHLSTEVPLKLAQYLVEEYQKGNPGIVRLLETRVVYIIPLVNPDGSEWDISTGKYKMWRKNRTLNADRSYGIDLNRNYSFGWGGSGSSATPSSDIYRGTGPFSEPETQAVKNFVETHPNLTTLLSFHTYSQLILYPYGHIYGDIPDDRDRRVHEVMAQTMAAWNGYKPQKASGLYLAAGDTTDWAYGVHRLISFTFELDPGSLWGGGFYPGQSYIQPTFLKNLKPALYLIEYADNPYRTLEPQYKDYGLNTPLLDGDLLR